MISTQKSQVEPYIEVYDLLKTYRSHVSFFYCIRLNHCKTKWWETKYEIWMYTPNQGWFIYCAPSNTGRSPGWDSCVFHMLYTCESMNGKFTTHIDDLIICDSFMNWTHACLIRHNTLWPNNFDWIDDSNWWCDSNKIKLVS